MKVLLISANREEINMLTWPLGLACVAAATQKAGYEVKLLDLMEANDPASALKETIREFNPEVIGISVRNIDDQSMENTQFLLDDVKEVVAVCRSLQRAHCLRRSGLQHFSREFAGIPGCRHGHSG